MNSTLAQSHPSQPAVTPENSIEGLPDLAALYSVHQGARKNWAERRRAKLSVGILVPIVAIVAVSELPMSGNSWAFVLLESLGCLLFIAGGALRFWAVLYIGGRKGSVVVDQGPYSLVRNPLYLGSFLMTMSLFVLLASFTALAAYLAVSIFYLAATVPSEERRLGSKHGSGYHDYCRRVPRFWPAWRRASTANVIHVDIHQLWLEAKRFAAWFWIPIAGQGLALLRLESWWPHWWQLP